MENKENNEKKNKTPKFCKVCGNEASPYYIRKVGEPYCSSVCYSFDKESKEVYYQEFVIPDTGEKVYVTARQQKIAVLLAMGYSFPEVAKMLKINTRYIESLVKGKIKPYNFNSLVSYYIKKYFLDFELEVIRNFYQKFREAMDKITKKDPLEWFRLYFEFLLNPNAKPKVTSYNIETMDITQLKKLIEDYKKKKEIEDEQK